MAVPQNPQRPLVPPHGPWPQRGADWMFGWVYGTVLAAGLLAALGREGEQYAPYSDAGWVLVTACAAALAHGYAHHMAGHEAGTVGHQWRLLMRVVWNEWPIIAATLPTVLLLVLAGATNWDSSGVTAVGLGLNTILLFAWGCFVAMRVGYGFGSSLLIGVADAAIGVAIIAANAVLK